MNEKTYLKDLGIENTGNVSDGYHTFDELYHHRTILYSVICNIHCECAWKTKVHSDGTSFDGWFLAGIDTPAGQISYHVEMKYWEMFGVRELDVAPKYDGHTSDDVLERVQSLIYKGACKCQKTKTPLMDAI